MKKYYLFISLMTIVVHSYSQWTTLISGTSNNLNSICFISHNIGFIVGDQGTILKTIDSGNSWSTVTCVSAEKLTSISFADSITGYIVGTNGTVLKTNNSGLSWNILNSSTSKSLNDVFLLDSDNCFLVGDSGIVLKTSNGGISWSSQQFNINHKVTSVYFTDSITGYFTTITGIIYKTTDKGNNWFSLYSQSSYQNADIKFKDSIGYMVGCEPIEVSSLVLKTDNLGNSWNKIQTTVGSVFFTRVDIVNDNMIYTVGSKGTILKTCDSGIIWNSEVSGTTVVLNDVYFTNLNTGFIVGQNGIILKNITGCENSVSENNLNKNESFIYPNPAKDNITIKHNTFSKETNIVITDFIGKEYFNFNYENQNEFKINIKSLSRGIYLIYERTDNKLIINKLIVE